MSCYRCKESTSTNKTFDARIKKNQKNGKTENGKSENQKTPAGPEGEKHTQPGTFHFMRPKFRTATC